MRVILTDRALARLRNIRSYIARHNPAAAQRVITRILRSAQGLSDNPLLGPRWRDEIGRAHV